MRFWLTAVALLLLLALSLRRGGQPEVFVALAYASSFFLVPAARMIVGQPSFLVFDPLLFFTDSAVMAVLVGIALRANRLWPLCASSLQLIVVIAHFAKFLQIKGMSGVYWGMTTMPIYLGYLALLIGIRSNQLRSVEHKYPDWRDD